MNFEKELKKRKTNIRACSIQSDIPYATLYPIIKGQVDIGTCSYFTVAKLARFLGYRPDEIVYEKEDFQTFRNNLHHRIKRNELECILEMNYSQPTIVEWSFYAAPLWRGSPRPAAYAILTTYGMSTMPLSHPVTFGNTFLKMFPAPLMSALLRVPSP